MHRSSYLNMKRFVDNYLDPREKLIIADLGSQNVDADSAANTYRPLFKSENWTYVGIDIAKGNNVDIVLQNAYSWNEIRSSTFDVIISGQAFEHIEYFWVTMSEIVRVLKEGGICCIIAPSSGFRHRFPVDCWRFYEDGFVALAKYAQLEVLQVCTQRKSFDFPEYDPTWNDSVLICKKPTYSMTMRIRNFIHNRLNRYLVTNLRPS